MSGFLSPRYLKYLEGPQRKAHDGLQDELLAGPESERRRLRAGLAIAFMCLTVAVPAWLFTFVAGFDGLSDATRIAYVALGLVLSALWACAAWALTPARLGRDHPRLRLLQILVRASQLMWPVACACRLVGVLRDEDWLFDLGGFLRLPAACGAILLAWQLWWLAERAQRENAARRLNAAVWLLAPVTLLPQVFPKFMPCWGSSSCCGPGSCCFSPRASSTWSATSAGPWPTRQARPRTMSA